MIPFDEATLFDEATSSADTDLIHDVLITSQRNGKEFRSSNRSRPWRRLVFSPDIFSTQRCAELLQFVRDRFGTARGFRVRDWTDYTTSSDDVSTPTSSTKGVVIDNKLYKVYDLPSGGTIVRRIFKPRSTSFQLYSGGSPVSSTLNTATGKIISGSGTSWSGYFDIPVHFSQEEVLSIAWQAFREGEGEIEMEEIFVIDEEDIPVPETVPDAYSNPADPPPRTPYGSGTPGGGNPPDPGGGTGTGVTLPDPDPNPTSGDPGGLCCYWGGDVDPTTGDHLPYICPVVTGRCIMSEEECMTYPEANWLSSEDIPDPSVGYAYCTSGSSVGLDTWIF